MIVKILIPLIVILLMVIVGTGLQLQQFITLFRAPIPVLGGTLLQMLLLPAGALGIIFSLNPLPELAAGLLLVSVCPGGALSNFYCHLGRLNVALSVMMTAVSSLLAFAAFPLILSIVFPIIGPVEETSIPLMELINRLFLMLLLPIGIGMTIRKYFRGLVEQRAILMRAAGLILVVALIALILYNQWEEAKRLFLDSSVIAILFTIVAALAGWISGTLLGSPRANQLVFAIEFAVRNVGIAAVVAATTLGRPEFVIFGALFVVIQFPLIMLLIFKERLVLKSSSKAS